MASRVNSEGNVRTGGLGPPFRVVDMPEPPPLSRRAILAIIGPSVIALGGSIGSGEWLIGPSVFVLWGTRSWPRG